MSRKELSKFEFYQEQVGDRIITVCAGLRVASKYESRIYTGISIRHPKKEDREGLGKMIAKNRCKAATDKKTRERNNKMHQPVIIRNKKLKKDRFLVAQVAKSYFFSVKHNLEDYIAAL